MRTKGSAVAGNLGRKTRSGNFVGGMSASAREDSPSLSNDKMLKDAVSGMETFFAHMKTMNEQDRRVRCLSLPSPSRFLGGSGVAWVGLGLNQPTFALCIALPQSLPSPQSALAAAHRNAREKLPTRSATLHP